MVNVPGAIHMKMPRIFLGRQVEDSGAKHQHKKATKKRGIQHMLGTHCRGQMLVVRQPRFCAQLKVSPHGDQLQANHILLRISQCANIEAAYLTCVEACQVTDPWTKAFRAGGIQKLWGALELMFRSKKWKMRKRWDCNGDETATCKFRC